MGKHYDPQSKGYHFPGSLCFFLPGLDKFTQVICKNGTSHLHQDGLKHVNTFDTDIWGDEHL